ILLACVGLLGLAMLSVSNRLREVSIRKVFGASAQEIAWLLSFDFMKPVIYGGLLAMPLAIYWANRWLEGFAYRVEITVLPLIAALLATLVICLLAVGGQTLKAA